MFTLTVFEKSSSLDIWQNSKYALGSIYAKVLNISRFWIWSYYKYALSSPKYARLLNMSRIHRVLNMRGYTRCYNMNEYPGLSLIIIWRCVNMLEAMSQLFSKVLNSRCWATCKPGKKIEESLIVVVRWWLNDPCTVCWDPSSVTHHIQNTVKHTHIQNPL